MTNGFKTKKKNKTSENIINTLTNEKAKKKKGKR